MNNHATIFSCLTINKQFSLLSRTLQHPVFANSLALLLLRSTIMGARLIALFIIARFASPIEFGYIAFALSVAEIAKIVADFGLDILTVRELTLLQRIEDKQVFINILAFAKLVCGVLVYAIIILYFSIQNTVPFEIIAILAMLTLTGLFNNLTVSYYQAQLRTREILLPVLSINIVAVVVIGILSVVTPNVPSFFFLIVLPVSEAVTFLMLLKRLQREMTLSHVNWRFAEMFKLLRRSFPLAVTAILVMLYTRLDVVVLKSFLGPEAVAYYAIAFRITEPFLFVAAAIGSSIYAHISITLTSDLKHRVRFLLFYYVVGMLFYSLLCCLFLVFVAPIIIHDFLRNYIQAIPVLETLAIALIFRVVNIPLNNTVLAFGQFTLITYVALLNLAVISILLFYCVPAYGIQGAAISLLVGEAMNTAIHLAIVNRIFVMQRRTILP